METKAFSIRLSEAELEKLKKIASFYGLSSTAEAIRFSIAKTAREISNENFKK